MLNISLIVCLLRWKKKTLKQQFVLTQSDGKHLACPWLETKDEKSTHFKIPSFTTGCSVNVTYMYHDREIKHMVSSQTCTALLLHSQYYCIETFMFISWPENQLLIFTYFQQFIVRKTFNTLIYFSTDTCIHQKWFIKGINKT